MIYLLPRPFWVTGFSTYPVKMFPTIKLLLSGTCNSLRSLHPPYSLQITLSPGSLNVKNVF